MPGRDGIGPVGRGIMTGRGLGPCRTKLEYGAGSESGPGCRCGFGRRFGRGFKVDQVSSKTQKELLQEQKNVLQNRLEDVNKQLENNL